MITELFEVTLPTATGFYRAGHVFQINATYDDAGTVMHVWGDGPDNEADFGGDDDILVNTANMADHSGATLFSDADLSISGLTLPAGATPRDVRNSNVSLYQEELDPETDGYWRMEFRADDLELHLVEFSPGWFSLPGESVFELVQYYTDASGTPRTELTHAQTQSSEGLITRTVIPEPSTLLLLGTGLIGVVGLARRRKN